MQTDIKSMDLSGLEIFLKSIGEPGFRAKQIFKWLSRGAVSFSEMTDLSKTLRNKLSELCYINIITPEKKQVSKTDKTVKFLWKLRDGNFIESVVMSYHHGNTVCISTQAGCRMGCKFCASALGGFVRNLTPAEMLDQVIFSGKEAGTNISNVVLMGIGEPLDNFENVIKFLKLVNHEDGINIGMRHISLSTCGIAQKIDELAEMGLQLTLSVSLHSPFNDKRSELMPVNKSIGLDRLITSCKNYYDKTGRRISFEYAVINGENDTPDTAAALAKLLRNIPCHINLIPVNQVAETEFLAADKKNIGKFKKILEDKNFAVTIRRSLGGDIDAACGQLRRVKEQNLVR